MKDTVTRRSFLVSVAAATSAGAVGNKSFAANDKRRVMIELLDGNARHDYIPAAFFIHFDKNSRLGEPAVRKHLEFFRATGMDFVKIQYERTFPPLAGIERPEDWKGMPHYKLDFYEPELQVVRGLIKAAKKEALVLITLYSPFMCAGHTAGLPRLTSHLEENPEQVKKGLEIITDSLMLFVKECIRLGVDGFYASTQGGEAGRFKQPGIFMRYLKPYDLVLMNEANRTCPFNILHVCDYNGPYDDLTPYLDYPGHIVNCNPRLTSKTISWQEIPRMFKRPAMGGLDRHGVIATGSPEEIRTAVGAVLKEAPRPFILGADCTLPDDIRWENIRTAVEAAHAFS
jgi:uroporphyrinogen decarboxylase